jgi:hypothetical protein
VTRYKWYRVRPPISTATLLRRIRVSSFEEDSDSGFLPSVLEGAGPNSFRFLWKTSVVAMSVDEDGNRKSQLVQSVDQMEIEFSEEKDFIWLRVMDPPRMSRELFNAIERIAGMGTSFEVETFSPKQQAKFIRSCDGYRLVGLRGVGSSVEHKVVARIELASKEGIRPEKLAFLEQLRFASDQTTYELTERGLKGQVTFTASGVVRIAGAIQPFVLSQLEAQLGIAR